MSARAVVASMVVVLAVAGAAAWSWLRSNSSGGVSSARERTAPLEPALPAPAISSPPEPASTPAPSHGPSRTQLRLPVATKKPAQEEAKTIGIDGRLVVVDARGDEHLEESGTLCPLFYDPTRSAASDPMFGKFGPAQLGEEVSVTAGRFHVEVPLGKTLSISKVVAGGRAALEVGDPIAVATGETATVRACWIAGITLHVVDATSHAELDRVSVVRLKDQLLTLSYPGAPDSLETVVADAASPVEVAPKPVDFGPTPNEFVFARAAGHAWSRVRLEFERVTEQTVELTAAATLVVDVQGELPHRTPPPPSLKEVAERLFGGGPGRARPQPELEPQLCLRSPSQAPDYDAAVKEALDHFDEAKPEDFPGGRKPTLAEFKQLIERMRGQYEASRDSGELHLAQPAKLGETRVEALAPGEFVVSVEIGADSETPLVAGKAAVKLIAGETTHASLVLAAVASPAAVPLAGTLDVPTGWNPKNLELVIEPIDLRGASDSDERRLEVSQMVALPGRPGWLHWSAGEVLPATWRFTVLGAGYSHEEKVGPSGDDHVELRLGKPATLVVHVVDEASGSPIKLKWLRYVPTGDELIYGVSQNIDLKYDGSRSRYLAVVPVGQGAFESFEAEEWTLDPTTSRIEVHSGEQEVTLKVVRACGVIVTLACGGAKVAWPEDLAFESKIEPIDPAGRTTWMSMRDDLHLGVAVPGRYRVTLAKIPGYAEVEPFEVDVPAGEFVTRTVALTRK